MSDIAVEVNHVWKKFHRGELHDSLRDLVPALAKRLVGRGPRRDDLSEGDFWALKDVSFQVKQGEVLGIIGPNGAGKSTLLKILSKIIKPTRGSVRVNGRLRALIEVAAGFHGDLTGRENIYLNGSILGMKKREIDKKFDEIVDFSGIEPFLDTPVKRYSSGMYARLGFAVAANLDPEVLIVDEVLAVGDAEFQKKCLGKMDDVAKSGRTVLFVSHRLESIRSLCKSSILISAGVREVLAPTEEVLEVYYGLVSPSDRCYQGGRLPADSDGPQATEEFTLRPYNSQARMMLRCGGNVAFAFHLDGKKSLPELTVGFTITTPGGERIVSMNSQAQNVRGEHSPSDRWYICCDLGAIPLNAGLYKVTVYIGDGTRNVARFTDAFTLCIQDYDVYGWGRPLPPSQQWGPLYWAPRWQIDPVM